MSKAPNNLEELKAVKEPVERIKAANAYIEQREKAIVEARRIRDADIRTLIEKHGPSEAARLAGMSLSTVKIVRGRP